MNSSIRHFLKAASTIIFACFWTVASYGVDPSSSTPAVESIPSGPVAPTEAGPQTEGAKVPGGAEPTSENNARLKNILKTFPQADANKDGILTLEEVRPLASMMGLNPDELKSQLDQKQIPPTYANVAYGPDALETLDFWKPATPGPYPVVVFIHGGGFKYGNKAEMPKMLGPWMEGLLKQGIACASINYRFTKTTALPDILKDGARSVQFIRSKSGDWNVDKSSIAAVGGSAGAGMSLWLSTRDDLADPASPDPVLKESSRVSPIVLLETQATYNFPRWDTYMGPVEFVQKPNEAAGLFHLASDEDLKTPEGQKLLQECDMLEWIGPGDGPIMAVLTRYGANTPDSNRSWDAYVHSSKHPSEIKKVCDAMGVSCVITKNKKDALEFLITNLKKPVEGKTVLSANPSITP